MTTYVYSKAIQGLQGKRGPTGQPGPRGLPGVGVPAGGRTHQVLIKLSDADYDFGWADIEDAVIVPGPDPVPNEAAYWAPLVEWAGYIHTYMITESNGDFKQFQTYYDGENCRYRLADHYNDIATYYPLADDHNEWYGDYYVLDNDGAVLGYWVFSQGLVERFIRRGDTESGKDWALLLLENAAYALTQGEEEDLSTQEFSREVAYALETKIHCDRMAGVTLSGPQLARREELFEWALGHLDIWAGDLGTYCRPFMVGITCKALIDYFDYVDEDSRILTKITAVANYIWDTCWISEAQAFSYTDRDVGSVDPVDLDPQPDLNMLVAPIFGWLWKQTSEASWRTKGDQIFTGGIAVYDGAEHISGSYLGTRSAVNPAGKQYNQQLYWGPKYIEWGNTGI